MATKNSPEISEQVPDFNFEVPGMSEFEDEMDRINAEIDRFLEQTRRENEEFLEEIDLADSPKFKLPDIEKMFKS